MPNAQAAIARAAGAERVFDRRDPALADQIRDGAGGVDRIIEVAFGANLETSLKVLKANGVIAAYSSDAEPTPALPFWPLVLLEATVRFVLVQAMTREAHEAPARAITEALEAGWLRHNIGRILPLERIAEAHELVESGTAGGKVVLEI